MSLLVAVLVALLLWVGPTAPQANAGTGQGKSRPLAKLVTVKSPKRAGGAIRLDVRVLRNLSGLSVKINGRRLRKPLDVNARRRLGVHLDATSGVRFGRNRILVRAKRGSRDQVVRRTVRVRTDAPLIGVRIPRHARQHVPVKLDARGTRSRGKGKLRYRWRIVAGPRRSHARLTGARRARPRLLASHPGRYLLALTVKQRGSAAKTSAANGCGVTKAAKAPPRNPFAPVSLPDGRPIASTPLEELPDPRTNLETVKATKKPKLPPADRLRARPRTATGCTTQYLGVDVDTASGPLGVAFESQVAVNGQTGTRVGGTFYPTPAGETMAVYLDADTLEQLGSTIVPAGQNAEDWATLMSIQYEVGHEVLILLTGPGFTLLKGATESDTTAVSNEGLVEGDGSGSPGPAGQLRGWLQPSIPIGTTDDTYRFVSPDRVTVSSGQGTGNSNTMVVGDQEYEATLPSGTEAGFHVLVTDPALRPILGTPAFFSTNTGDPGLDAQQQGALANLLKQANATTAGTVIMQSIGSPRPTTQASVVIGQQIEDLGGSEWMFLSMDGTTGYALIGNPGALGAPFNDQAAAEASAKWTETAGSSLQGLLKRRHDGAMQATLADAVGGMDFTLQQIAFQAPVSWPETDTAAKRAAGTWISRQLEVPTQGPGLCASTPKPDLRAEYCNLSVAPLDWIQELGNVSYSPSVDGFSEDDFDKVKAQYVEELGKVDTVRDVITQMQAPFLLQNGTTAVDAQKVSLDVIDSIPTPSLSPVSADLGLASAVLYAAGEVPVIGEAFGPFAAGLDLASDLTEEDGVPSPDWDIEAVAATTGFEVDARIAAAYEALGSYGAILVSDSGKLNAADNAAKTTWGQDSNAFDSYLSLLQLGVEQWLYTAIVPAAYDLIEIPGAVPSTASDQVHCVYSSAPYEWKPWAKADQRSMFFPLNSWAGGAPAAGQMMGMLHGFVGNKNSNPVGSKLAQEMFGSSDSGGAALVRPWFYNRADWDIKHPTMVQPSTPLKPGVCKVGYI